MGQGGVPVSDLRVLVLGGGGMLGHKLWQRFSARFDTWVTVRMDRVVYRSIADTPAHMVVSGVDATDLESIQRALRTVRPDVIVNAIGIVKQLVDVENPIASITVNSLFPHRLAQVCKETGIRLVHVSTDCVFSGVKGMYGEGDLPDPVDLYGRSKLLGEVNDTGALTVRTSMIGREIASSYGLVEWFLSNDGGSIRGFTGAVFSGFPTLVLADIIGDIVENHADLSGVYHVAAEPIDKYRLLRLLREAYNVNVEIEPDDTLQVDRSLDGTTFREATGFVPASWSDLVKAMTDDSTPYEELRR